MSKKPLLHIIHIMECIARIHKYTENDYDLFCNDRKTYDAVIRNLQTMAESAQKLDESVKSRYTHIQWNKIAGFRNILVHDYLGDIDSSQVWTIIAKYLPELQKAMQLELPNWQNIMKP